jgi:hypothetical protein
MIDKELRADNWRAACPKEILDWLNKAKNSGTKKKFIGGSRWVNDGRLSPIDFYCYLKARFGDPNGPSMLLKTPSVDNLIHWHYTLLAGDHYIQIFGLSFRTEISFEGVGALSKNDWDEIIESIKVDFGKYGKMMGDIRKVFEKWILFTNPYKRFERIIDSQIDGLKELNIGNLPSLKRPVTSAEHNEYFKKFNDYLSLYHQAISQTLYIQFLCPVLAEAFINLIIFILGKPEIKQDQRWYQNVIRTEIDIKVKSLHNNCQGFERPIDYENLQFKEFHSLMNRRNDLLHGNVDPMRLQVDEIYYDHWNIPLMKFDKSLADLTFEYALRYANPEDAYRDSKIVKNFTEFILSHIGDKLRERVIILINQDQLGWHEDNKMIGAIMPENPAEMFAFE